jgi:hypothetical protein
MMRTELHVPASTYELTLGHLFAAMDTEHAAFLFARASTRDDTLLLSVEGHHLVEACTFARRSAYHFELGDDVQRQVIKQAHDRQCCLIEAHSHPFPSPACFSGTDITGLLEWVSHVRWRLAGRPYGALVVAPGSFDGLIFAEDNTQPTTLERLIVGRIQMCPTGATAEHWEVFSNGRHAL